MLTPVQQKLATWIVSTIQASKMQETFYVLWGTIVNGNRLISSGEHEKALVVMENGEYFSCEIDEGAFQVLRSDDFIQVTRIENYKWPKGISISETNPSCHRCTVKQKLFDAVAAKFVARDPVQPLAEGGQPQPLEIVASLKRLRLKFPGPKPLGFLIMRFTATAPYKNLVRVIKETGEKNEVIIIRADDSEFHADLWGNVRTLLHSCSFGIAVYERINTDEPNANIGLEVGYLMAMNKPVLLLKDSTLPTLQTDLAGRLYKSFDAHNPEGTVPIQLEAWLKDNGIVL